MNKKSSNAKKSPSKSGRWINCQVEDDYFGHDRKSAKKARKEASAADRSKYKKTDIKKTQAAAAPAPEVTSDTIFGRVLSIASEGIKVSCTDGSLYTCFLRGALKKDKGQAKNLVCVGDKVRFVAAGSNEGSIYYVEPRLSVLARADNLSRRKQQVIAANIDLVLITVSVVLPALKPALVDRYIIAAHKGNMQCAIVVNKIDLLADEDTGTAEERAAEKELLAEFTSAYAKLGIPVILLSAQTGAGMVELSNLMQGKASVFSGQSGVGKSSLINHVTGHALRVGKAVDKTKKGAHTTTTANLIPLTEGGFCIDTPGIKSFGVWNLSKEEVESYFDEIHEMGAACKFPDCSHEHEEGCAVMDAVNNGILSLMRYTSYLYLRHSLSEEHVRR